MKRRRLKEIKMQMERRDEKASDMDILIEEIMKLPPGQLKKLLTDGVKAVLKKYGYSE